jgi:hypothetical protein
MAVAAAIGVGGCDYEDGYRRSVNNSNRLKKTFNRRQQHQVRLR